MIDAYDVITVIGLGMLGVGLWMVSPLLSLVVVGGLLVAGGLIGSLIKASDRKRGKG